MFDPIQLQLARKQISKAVENLMESSVKWESFVETHLLSTNLTEGVCLLSPAGQCVYHQGTLKDITEENWKSFKFAADKVKRRTEDNQHLVLDVKYRVYHKTFSSLYAIAEGGQKGLIVGYFSCGVVVCTYSQTQNSSKVVRVVEELCDLLRA